MNFKHKPIDEQIENWLSFHRASPEQAIRIRNIFDAAKDFALIVTKNTPNGLDQTVAIRKIREAVMTANASIACDE